MPAKKWGYSFKYVFPGVREVNDMDNIIEKLG
jgi:hypothetical protein